MNSPGKDRPVDNGASLAPPTDARDGADTMGVEVTEWEFGGRGPFSGRADHRDLLQIAHPWEDSAEGNYGAWTVRIALPAQMVGAERVYVSFYQSDNYSGERNEDPGWLGVQAFSGHRFKELVVNGEVVWEEDVSSQEMIVAADARDYDLQGPPAYHDAYRVVALEPAGHDMLELTFRVMDRLGSATVLAGDQYVRYSWGLSDPEVSRNHFHTEAFFGDVALSLSPGVQRPVPRHSHLPSRREGDEAGFPASVPLEVWTPAGLPPEGYPVRCGVPFPRGMVAPGTPMRLETTAGQGVAAAITETSHWPDDSVRWVLCEFVARSVEALQLTPGAEGAPVQTPVRVIEDDGGLTVDTGRLRVCIGPSQQGEGLFESLSGDGAPPVGPCHLSMKLNRVGWLEAFSGQRLEAAIESASDLCVVVLLTGEMRSEAGTMLGPWQARLEFWAGCPYLLVGWRVINESNQAMAMLLDWSARLSLPDATDALADFGAFEPMPLEIWKQDGWYRASPVTPSEADPRALPVRANSHVLCRQERADHAVVYQLLRPVGYLPQAPGYLRLSGEDTTLVAAMRWFAEEFPTGFVVEPHGLHLATLPEALDSMVWHHDVPWVRLGRGESKRQDFALWQGPGGLAAEAAERFNACVQDPPRLFNRAWFADCGALETTPSDAPGEYEAAVGEHLAVSGIGTPRLGHREYWDTAWMNNYRSRAHAGLMRYVATGDARWFRYFDAACRHHCDVDIIRYCPEHPEWVGATHQYSADHSSGPPMGNIGLNSDDLLEHYLMTGDPDNLEVARGLAEHILGCEPRERSARAVGWPLAQMTRWYDETGDARFLARAKEFLAAAALFTEPRRGIFDEIHGVWSYHGSVPFMTAYLAYGLIRFHQLTDDHQALRLLCLLADGVLAECQPAPGRFRYSPAPENNLHPNSAATASWSANIGGLCGYIFLQTGEPVYREGLIACYEAVMASPERVTLDMVELQGWMLRAVKSCR